MKKPLMLIINPVAGKGGFKSGLGEVLETFYHGGYSPTIYFTTGKSDATKLAQEHASNYELVVCCGGDGTLSEVVSGLMKVPSPPPLGYIPMGTANDVATTLSLPRNTVKAAQLILSGEPMPFDVGSFGNDAYFTYISAFGAFTEVSYETPQESKQAWGQLAYILEGMLRLPKITDYHCTVEYDGGIIEDNFIFGAVTNSISVAGMLKLDDNLVELGDGLFEVILIRKPRSLLDMNSIITDVLSKNYQGQQVTILKSKKIHFTFNQPVAWTRDGESGGRHQDVELANHQAAVHIIS